MPVLTVGGAANFGAHLEGQIRPLATDVRSVVIDACGHYLAEEQPERVAEELLTFFGEVELNLHGIGIIGASARADGREDLTFPRFRRSPAFSSKPWLVHAPHGEPAHATRLGA